MKGRSLILVVVGLVAGLTLGALGVAAAEPVVPSTAETAAGHPRGLGPRLGPVMRDAGGRMVDVLAELTGLDLRDIFERRADGESFAQIAESEGVDSGEVLDGVLEARKAVLDERVSEGVLNAEQGEAILQRMERRLAERMESTDPPRRARRGAGRFGPGRPGEAAPGFGGGGGPGFGNGPGGGCGYCAPPAQ